MLGAELRKARLSAGLTQEQLSVRAGISREYVSMLERDRKSPTVDMLFRVCRAMGEKPSKVVQRVESKGAIPKP